MIFIYSEKVDITLEQIDNWDKENIIFIDTRGRIAYYHGHIDNAILLEDVQNVIKSILWVMHYPADTVRNHGLKKR